MRLTRCLPPPARRLDAASWRWSSGLIVVVAVLLAGVFPEALRAQGPPPASVTVRPGDTLGAIAVRFYGSPDAISRIVAANKLANPDLIVEGMRLQLPGGTGGATATATTPTATPATVAGAARQVTVQSGDTLALISQRVYGSDAYAAAIASANGLANADRISSGMTLTLPQVPAATRATAQSTTPQAAAIQAATAKTAQPAAASGSLSGRRICLDPGHGGDESGAAFTYGDGRVLREADVVLDIALTLRGWLRGEGAIVTMTRTTDANVGLDERAAICNAAGADIALSMHLNGGGTPQWNGAAALFAKPIDRRLAESLAGTFQSGLGANAPGTPFTAYGAFQFDGRVLLKTKMPAVIAEPVFLTNPGEARALLAPTAEPNRRYQILLETYRGLRQYFANS